MRHMTRRLNPWEQGGEHILSGVPTDISPELLKALYEMRHGDTLVIGGVNFPAASIAVEKNHVNIRYDGHRATDMLGAILQSMPLDSFVEKPVIVTDKMEMHRDLECPVRDELTDTVVKHGERGVDVVGFLDRFTFYDAAKGVYAVVSAPETAFYTYIMI